MEGDQAGPAPNLQMGKLSYKEEEGCTSGVGPELGPDPTCPTAQSGLRLPQLTVSVVWSGGYSVGTEPWDCGPWWRSRWGTSDREGHCRAPSEVVEPVALRYEGGLRCTPRRLFCTWRALGSSAGIPESGHYPTSCLTEPAPCPHLWWRLMTQRGLPNRIGRPERHHGPRLQGPYD